MAGAVWALGLLPGRGWRLPGGDHPSRVAGSPRVWLHQHALAMQFSRVFTGMAIAIAALLADPPQDFLFSKSSA